MFLLYLLLWFWDFTITKLQDFIKIYRALIKDIFLWLITLLLSCGTLLGDVLVHDTPDIRLNERIIQATKRLEVLRLQQQKLIDELQKMHSAHAHMFDSTHVFGEQSVFHDPPQLTYAKQYPCIEVLWRAMRKYPPLETLWIR